MGSVTKYFCDVCQKELTPEMRFNKTAIVRVQVGRQASGSEFYRSWELCAECVAPVWAVLRTEQPKPGAL